MRKAKVTGVALRFGTPLVIGAVVGLGLVSQANAAPTSMWSPPATSTYVTGELTSGVCRIFDGTGANNVGVREANVFMVCVPEVDSDGYTVEQVNADGSARYVHGLTFNPIVATFER
jgi:hypothetical protein